MKFVLSLIAALSLVGWLSIGTSGVASAGPTCSDSELIDVQVHGEHIVGDYVTGVGHGTLDWPPAGQVGETVGGGGAAIPGGPGPGFHFTIEGLPPGASFCNEQAHPNGFDTPEHFE
jgi:hypothetical protein